MAGDFTLDLAPHQIPPLLLAIKEAVGGLSVEDRMRVTNKDMDGTVLVFEFASKKATVLPGCLAQAKAASAAAASARQIFEGNLLDAQGHAAKVLARLGIPRAKP